MEEIKEYPNPWKYMGAVFDGSLIGDNYGFVYCITSKTTGRKYIGRKYFWSKRKPRTVSKTGNRRRVTTESDWKKYYGSCPELKEDVGRYGRDDFDREIISLHLTKGKVNYEETHQLFVNDVLRTSMSDGTPMFYNSNILGRYYRKDYFEPPK